MRLIQKGHDRIAAIEQAILNFFPDRPDGETVSKLSFGKVWTTACVSITLDGRTTSGCSRAKTGGEGIDNAIKQAAYKAALPHLQSPPPWGSLTGIRPAKLASKMIKAGKNPAVELRDKYYVSPERIALAVECAKASIKVAGALNARDISLYAGVPFCPSKCAYCSFVSNSTEKTAHLVEPYLNRLTHEIGLIREVIGQFGLNIVSIYVGGGTPTSLSEEMLKVLCRELDWKPSEYTVEAGRPDSITMEKLITLKEYGVNRISINPQTLNDDILVKIGRKHTARQAEESFRLARSAGFDRINTDLIAGLPGDTPEGFTNTLESILTWSPENITVHTLALKRGSRLSEQPCGAGVDRMLEYTAKRLTDCGYKPYYLYRQKFMAGGFENVGWCKPDTENIYNITMMEDLGSVISVGAGGVTKLVKDGVVKRDFHCKYPLEYLERYDKMSEAAEFIKDFLNEQHFNRRELGEKK